MNAIDLLINDHRELQKLIEKLENSPGRAKRKLFEQIKLNATLHEKAEEKFLYPYLLAKKKYQEHALEHYEEVKIMSRLLKEMTNFSSITPEWSAKFSVFKELTNNHIDEEENEFFPEISALLTHDLLDEIGEKIAEYKEKMLRKKD